MLAVQNMVVDGDDAFIEVDTWTPAQALKAGQVADARNRRFEDGRSWPRHGINQQSWGSCGAAGTLSASSWPLSAHPQITVSGLTIGRTYHYTPGNSFRLTHDSDINDPNGYDGATDFLATTTTMVLWGSGADTGGVAGQPVTASVRAAARPRAFARWADPQSYESLVLLTDEWRDGNGEDGGRGRAWRVRSGSAPVAVSLNGHDVYGEARLIPCRNGLVLARQDNERHYFNAAAVDTATDRIQLNAAPAWNNGDQVLYVPDGSSYIVGASAPLANTLYFVKNITGSKVELYFDAALTNKLSFSGGSALGRFYLERKATAPGFFGNGAPPLILQESASSTAWEVGFVAVPTNVFATAEDSSSPYTLTAPNHRLIPGDAIKYVDVSGPTTTTYYARPTSEHTLTLHLSADAALAGSTPQNAGFGTGDYLYKAGGGALPMPPLREGCYTRNNRLVGVNGVSNLPISDPLDPLHFAPFESDVNANLGESDGVTAVVELGVDAVLIAKANKLELLQNFSQGTAGWALAGVTSEYGISAPLSAIAVGADAWGLGRKGIVSVRQTVTGELQGVAVPMSQKAKLYMEMIDWRYAAQACAGTWNNRVFFAVPLKGQSNAAGAVVKNNGVVVFNLLNGGWEGLWTGAGLEVYCFARHLVFGEDRLTFVDYNGLVKWFGDGTVDFPATEIATSLTSRLYGGDGTPKLWLEGRMTVDQLGATVTVTAQAPGHNEEQTLLDEKTYDATKYLVYGQADYDPSQSATRFDDPHREDYSLQPEELTTGQLDAYQNINEALRMRVRDWGVQLVVETSAGSARVVSLEVRGVPKGRLATREG